MNPNSGEVLPSRLEARQKKVKSLLVKADSHYRKGHRLRAIWNYRRVLSLEPDHVVALVNLALIYSTVKGKHDSALQMLQRASEIQPDNPAVLLNLATLTAQKGELGEALNLLERAEQQNPRLPDLHYNKAHLYAIQKKWDEAMAEVAIELHHHPSSYNALLMKEAIEQHRKNTASAEVDSQPD